jgi:DNA invertase Pin-like site-specific DNA recombinase
MKIGYARVSTEEQNLHLQRDALKKAGCKKIVTDKGVSGNNTKRDGLDRALKQLKKRDVLVVWKLDRLGRSLRHLIELIETLREKGAGFQSVSDGISTTTAGGQLVFHIMGALAEFERSLIIERTKAGLEAAKRRGKYPGRPNLLSPQQIKHARKMLGRGEETTGSLAALFGVDRTTIWRALQKT